jgi:hypothetical protein
MSNSEKNNKSDSDSESNSDTVNYANLVNSTIQSDQTNSLNCTDPLDNISSASILSGSDNLNKSNSDAYEYPEDIIDTTKKPNPNPTNFKQLIGSYVKLLQMKMNTDEFKFLKKFHSDEYEKKLGDFVPAFKNEYPFLFKMIISGADLAILDMFLENISDIDTGKKTLNDARNDLGNILHNKFVKDKLK